MKEKSISGTFNERGSNEFYPSNTFVNKTMIYVPPSKVDRRSISIVSEKYPTHHK